MPELDYAEALARLLSSSSLRERFAATPQAVLDELRVRAAARPLLCLVDREDLEHQARGLLHKRLGAVRALLPATFDRLLAKAAPLFFEHAERYWPQGHRRHLLDAEHFCRFLDERGHRPVAHEHRRLRFALSSRRLSLAPMWREPNPAGRRTGIQVLWRHRDRLPGERHYYLSFR